MKYILCQPAIKRFQWELEVVITNLKSLGVEDIVLLFAQWDDSIPTFFKNKYGVETHVYDDRPRNKTYIPNVKPYLWWKYLEEDSNRENEDYIYIDSDVIFRELPDSTHINPSPNRWYGSECSGYLGVDYIDSKGEDLLERMCEIINVDEDLIRSENPTAGAQWIISCPTSNYWRKVYEDSIKLYQFLCSVEHEYIKENDFDENYTPIQKWTAEMWAQLWNIYYFNRKTKVTEELSFCWPTDNLSEWDKHKILHNAGITEKDKGYFFKGQYVNTTPFEDNLNHVRTDKATIKYVEAINKVKL